VLPSHLTRHEGGNQGSRIVLEDPPSYSHRSGILVPPPSLSYFMEWGGGRWEHLFRSALQEIGDLHGKRVLEIGPRFGKLSCYFALLGANVTGVETNATALKVAENEARRWGVQASVSFVHYDGDLENCQQLVGEQFDIIFSKSVLVLLGDALVSYLWKLERIVKPAGQCIFLENRHGGPLFWMIRRILPRTRQHYRRITYLTPTHIRTIGRVFDLRDVRKSLFPPVYLIRAQKKQSTAGHA
jgi:SAM-dependent methyltransferase